MPKRRKFKKKKKNPFKPPVKEGEASSTENDGIETVRALRCTILPFDYDLNPIENYKVIMEDLKTVLIYILNENTELIDATESVIAILERRNIGVSEREQNVGKLVMEKDDENIKKLMDEDINNEISENFQKGINIHNDESDTKHADKNIAKQYGEKVNDNIKKDEEQEEEIEVRIDENNRLKSDTEIEKKRNEQVVEQFLKNVNEKYNKLIKERSKSEGHVDLKTGKVAVQQVCNKKGEKKLEDKQFHKCVVELAQKPAEVEKQSFELLGQTDELTQIEVNQSDFEQEINKEHTKKVELKQSDDRVREKLYEQFHEHVELKAEEQSNEHPAWIQFVEKISMEVNEKMEVEDRACQQLGVKVDNLVNKQDERIHDEKIGNAVAIEIPIKPLSEADIRKYCRNILQYEDNVRHLRDRFSTKSQETLRALRDSRDNYGKTNIVLTHEVMFNHQPSRKQIGRLKNLQEAETLFETLVCNTKNVEKVRKISLDLCCISLSKSMRIDFEQGKCTLDNLRCLQKRLQAVQNGIDIVEKELQDIEFGWRMFISL